MYTCMICTFGFTHTIIQSEYFLGMAMKPTIASFSAYEGLDSSGGKSVEVELYCTVNGMDKVKMPLFILHA